MAQPGTDQRRRSDGQLSRRAMALVAEVAGLGALDAERTLRERCAGSPRLLAECLSLLRHDRAAGAVPKLSGSWPGK